MKSLLPLALLTLSLAAAVRAEDAAVATVQPMIDTEARKTHDGFTGAILATTDRDWAAKWNNPTGDKPDFTLATSVPPGKPVFVLVFFVNPKVDGDGNVNVRCDIRITGPDGTVTLDKKDSACFEGKYAGGANDVALAPGSINFSGEPDDPEGFWTFEVMLRDANRNTEFPLKTGFTLSRPKAKPAADKPTAAPAKKKAKN
jgi:hypothetical protein